MRKTERRNMDQQCLFTEADAEEMRESWASVREAAQAWLDVVNRQEGIARRALRLL